MDLLINYGLKEDGETFDWWQNYPVDTSKPYLNLTELGINDPTEIVVGKTKLINGQIVQPLPPKLTDEELKEKKVNAFRAYRNHMLKGFDVWEKNVLRGREQDDNEIMAWYYLMLDFPNQITKDTTFEDYPKIPDKIKKYLGM